MTETPLAHQENTANGVILRVDEGQRETLNALLLEQLTVANTEGRRRSRRYTSPEATPFFRDLVVTMLYELLLYGILSFWGFSRTLMKQTNNQYSRELFEVAVSDLLALLNLKRLPE